MEFVIFDLEWDSVYYKPEKRFINQILQIGAVRLDENFRQTADFEVTVKSGISRKVTRRFSTLTGITAEKMLTGISYADAVQRFNEFTAGADVMMTWSDSDLHTIIENEILLADTGVRFQIEKYLDLQKLAQHRMQEMGYENKNQVSLGGAAEFFGIDTSGFEMHTAQDDSAVCGKLLKICYNRKLFDTLLRNFAEPDFSGRLRFKAYPVTDLNNRKIDRTQLRFTCPECGAPAAKKKKWKYRNRWFSSVFQCESCGYSFLGRLYIKMTYDGPVYKRRTSPVKVKEVQDEVSAVPEKV